MVDGGLGATTRRQQRLERALSASTFLPTFAFAALGTVTVILVALMGMSQPWVIGPSAHDLGLTVTTPQMSVSIAPPLARPFAPAGEHKTSFGGTSKQFTATVEVPERADLVVTLGLAVQRAPQAKSAVAPGPAPEPASKPADGASAAHRGEKPALLTTLGAQGFGQGQAFGQAPAFGQGRAFNQGQMLVQGQALVQRQTTSQRQALTTDEGSSALQLKARQAKAAKALKQANKAKALKQAKAAKALKHTPTATKAPGPVKASRIRA